MNDALSLPQLKFGVGQPVHRKEAPRLVRQASGQCVPVSIHAAISAPKIA
jgi:hypothetical protein